MTVSFQRWSVFVGKQDRGDTAVGFRDDPELDAGAARVDGEEAHPIIKRLIVEGFVFGTDLAPIMGGMASQNRENVFRMQSRVGRRR